jgi:hypothetical protein
VEGLDRAQQIDEAAEGSRVVAGGGLNAVEAVTNGVLVDLERGGRADHGRSILAVIKKRLR